MDCKRMTMKKTFVNANNVIQIAQLLLQLEIHHLQEKYHLDAESFVDELQKALINYINEPNDTYEIKKWNTIDNIERSLKHLLYSVNSFITLLTPEAQKKLEQQFHSSYEGIHHYGYIKS